MKTVFAILRITIVVFVVVVAGVYGWVYYETHKPAPVSAGTDTDEPEKPKLEFPGLSDAKQSKIWDLEHFTFELEHKFGKAFATALKNRESETLQGFFQDEFAGTVLPSNGRTEVGETWWREVRQTADDRVGSSELMDDPTTLIGDLVASLKDFKVVDHTRLRVLAIDPDAAGESLWKLKVLLTGTGTNAQGGPISFESTHDVRCRFANDEQIASGQIITGWHVVEKFVRSAPATFMQEVTEQFGLKELELLDNWTSDETPLMDGFQIAVDDFNRDGYPDIAVCSSPGRQYLLQSVNGTSFRDVTSQLGVPPFNDQESMNHALVSWIDFDNDGYPDLLMGDALYHNVGGRQFEDVTAASGLRIGSPGGMIMGCAVADYDLDGFLDLYLLYQGSAERVASQKLLGWVGDNKAGAANQLWRNTGRGKFVNVTDAVGAGGGTRHTFAAAWLHANEDSLPDLYIVNDFGTNSLLLNRGDHFEDVAPSRGVGDFATSMGVAAGDIDGDAQTEIYVANMYSKMGRRIIAHVAADDYPPGVFEQIQGSCAGNRLYQWKPGEQRYQEIGLDQGVNDVGWAYAPAFVDLDCDGFLDIYATTGFLSFVRGKPDG